MHLCGIRSLGSPSTHKHEAHYFCFTISVLMKTVFVIFSSFAELLLPFVLRRILLNPPVHLLYLYNICHLNSR